MRKANKFFLICVLHICMGDTQGKISKSPRWLEFKLKYHLHRERERGEEMIFRKDE